eukprot:12764648-Alexandrium_andersonii.AAC.1
MAGHGGKGCWRQATRGGPHWRPPLKWFGADVFFARRRSSRPGANCAGARINPPPRATARWALKRP